MFLDDVKEHRVEIKHVATGALVTVIEVLSPSNKIRGSAGRKSFMDKRMEVLGSDAHWVEIDLLRAGVRSLAGPELQDSDYRILVLPAERRNKARLWPVEVREPLPVIGIPLRAPNADAPLDLGAVLRESYKRAAYDVSVDYRGEPDPPLREHDDAWADRLLRRKGLR